MRTRAFVIVGPFGTSPEDLGVESARGGSVAPEDGERYGLFVCHGRVRAHAHPETAVFLDPVEGDWLRRGGRLWRLEGRWEPRGLGVAAVGSVGPVREDDVLDTSAAVAVAAAVAAAVGPRTKWWSRAWLSGVDRTAEAALKALADAWTSEDQEAEERRVRRHGSMAERDAVKATLALTNGDERGARRLAAEAVRSVWRASPALDEGWLRTVWLRALVSVSG